MKKFKGTKGKWTKSQNNEGNMIISSPEWRDFITVAFVHPRENTKQRREECLANAKLIAAAPELLEALQDSMKFLVEIGTKQSGQVYYKAMEAIKKATS